MIGSRNCAGLTEVGIILAAFVAALVRAARCSATTGSRSVFAR